MVERPIKKSERQDLASSETGSEAQPRASKGSPNLERRSSDGERRPPEGGGRNRDRDKGKGRGKGGDRGEGRPERVNMALMRGPKPSKAQPAVEEPEPTPAEAAELTAETEAAIDEVAEAAEAEPA